MWNVKKSSFFVKSAIYSLSYLGIKWSLLCRWFFLVKKKVNSFLKKWINRYVLKQNVSCSWLWSTSRRFQRRAAVVTTVAAEHALPFDSSSDILFRVCMLSLWLHGISLDTPVFFHSAKTRMHTGRMHFFKTPCFTDYNHFCVVRNFFLLSFLHYIPMWWIRQKRTVRRTETGRKTKLWSPNITNDKKNCWSQKAEKKRFPKV